MTPPQPLIDQLHLMRQNPADFTYSEASCGWCAPIKGNCVKLAHVDVKEAGLWCPEHGWRYWESGQLQKLRERK